MGEDPGMDGVQVLVEAELVRLSCVATDAMRRHALESLGVTISGRLDRRAAALQRDSPAPLLRRLLQVHLWSLPWADWLDDQARPLQERGILILTNDLPPIPAWPVGRPRRDAA